MEKVNSEDYGFSYIDCPDCHICFDCKLRVYPDNAQWDEDVEAQEEYDEEIFITYKVEPIKLKIITTKNVVTTKEEVKTEMEE